MFSEAAQVQLLSCQIKSSSLSHTGEGTKFISNFSDQKGTASRSNTSKQDAAK